jgi:hypothetical protein
LVELQLMNPYAVHKDLNWVERNRNLESGSINNNSFPSQLHKDIALLSELNVISYRLLIDMWISLTYLVSKCVVQVMRNE